MKFDRLTSLPPTIDLGDYRLRTLRSEDAPAWYGYLSDIETIQLTSYDVSSVDTVQQYIAHYLSGYEQRSSSRWAIADAVSDQLIGTCGYYWWNPQDSLAELSYDLSKDYWGKGIMSQAVKAVLRWGFDVLEINRIQATVMVGNNTSARILEKCGFQKEGLLREYKFCRGELKDFWLFAHLRREYGAD